ncbi:DinB family protein [Neobacillus rhizophilus]|uniref:DinB family protein n=1 Tax=Neobacillus rhizophilus TaxID=2833579 RepID=A0A942U924_9BACI|nr:DinB family protein [Neobacillus rhizophilus]MBS4215182.1 DinB family protein [Neobacillus rhizophilus]
MSKDQIIKEKISLIEWVASLKEISNDLWFNPFKEGAWGIADVISHFISWDKFLITNRVSYIYHNEEFPEVNIDVEAINKMASQYARSGISKEELISEFITVRKELVSLLQKIPEETFSEPYPGRENMTIGEYFVGMIEHDLKHKEQIVKHIKKE